MSRRPLKPALEPQPVASVATQPPQQHGEDTSAPDVDSSGNSKEETLSPTTPISKKRKATKPPAESTQVATGSSGPSATTSKRPRTNTPWTPQEEQRLKQMRDAGNSWSEIAKTFPLRTEGSVKKHWYKDMHYAEFAEDESAALLAAIREYDANKWKTIGQKLGKPAKACEQYAKEHFPGK